MLLRKPPHNPLLVMLPVLPSVLEPYRRNPNLKEVIDLAGGPKDLAEFAAYCVNRYGDVNLPPPFMCRHSADVDEDQFYYGVSELLYTTLETEDIDPRQTKFNRKKVDDYAQTDEVRLYLEMFFEQHARKYRQLLGELLFLDLEPIKCRQSDAIALLITTA